MRSYVKKSVRILGHHLNAREIQSNTCNEFYVGSTTRTLHLRLTEHLRDRNSSIYKHLRTCIDESREGVRQRLEVRVLTTENDTINLRIKEAMLIKQRHPSMNSREEMKEMQLLF